MRSFVAITLASLAISASAVSCGEDPPAVCGSVADLKSSVGQIRQIDLKSSGVVDDLKSALRAVQSDLAEVKADANSKFGTQLDAVEHSYQALRTSVESVQSGASAATLANAGEALSAFGSDVQALITDIQSTC